MFALSTVFVHITHYCIFVGPDMTLEGTPGMVSRLFCGRCHARNAKRKERKKGKKVERRRKEGKEKKRENGKKKRREEREEREERERGVKSGMEKRIAPAGYFPVGPFQPRIPFCRL